MTKTLLLFLVMAVLQACTPSRYAMKHDAAPVQGFDATHVPDAVPRFEIKTEAGNQSPYRVLGKTYHVLASEEGFQQKGIASWYGRKFHGHKTSNGEIYSMYEMTAAHKTLPIPSYVRVTNVDNGQSVIVRVNDRGPFHEGRIIDLSYAAAHKLGYAQKGTANVVLEAITVSPNMSGVGENNHESSQVTGQGYFIQVGAYSSLVSATKVKTQLEQWYAQPVFIGSEQREGSNAIHRVRMGPFLSRADAEKVQGSLLQKSYTNAIIIIRSIEQKNAA